MRRFRGREDLLVTAIAGLPMYDLPEVRGAMAALWTGIAGHLRHQDVPGVPDTLTFGQPVAELCSDPALLLSQCCGADLVGALAGALRPVATPRYRAPGCAGTRYASVVVVAEAASIRRLADLRHKVVAVNGPHSHSGMNALRALIAPISRDGRFFDEVVHTGAHVASLAMVASGEADCAAIDCVVHALLARHRPAALAGTRVLCRTGSAPAPPYVTRADADDVLLARLRSGLQAAIDDPDLAAARDDLLLDGIEVLPPFAYDEILGFERRATHHGYAELR